ncbi:MAG TPA: hypothetical protein GX692_00995 [Acholeplasmataceae bacterium]|nr:hypothetical protein [Acholeplasmataceae bacterium]
MDDWIDGRSEYVVWRKDLNEEEVRRRYFEMTGRAPDRIHSPEESATDWWWTGWVSKKEYYEYEKRRKENE